MNIVPVLDLLGGAVVRARRGERASYRPIETPLASGAAPLAVARGLMRLADFPALYVADLDAIGGRGDNLAAIAALRLAFPALPLWVDAGVADRGAVERLAALGVARIVLGSESQRDARLLAQLAARGDVILSLDFRGEAFLGPAAILDDPALWPRRVIAMTLARVGAEEGPDFARLAAIRARAGGRSVIAAGGVRGRDDLARLRAMGIAAALVASALHDGRLAGADVAAFCDDAEC